MKRVEIMHGGNFPKTMEPGMSTTIEMKIKVKPDDGFDCRLPFNCRYKFSENGVELQSFNMEFLNVDGCPAVVPVP